MIKLWQTRLSKHQQQQFKYLHYVFNDHFVIALIFLFGAAVYGYANLLKHLPVPFLLGRWSVLIILLIALQFGHLATLIAPADGVFLLPQTYQMYTYLRKSRHYSCLVPMTFLLLVNGVLYPLLTHNLQWSTWQWFLLVITTFLLKDAALRFELALSYEEYGREQKRWLMLLIDIVVLAVVIFLNIYVGLVLAVGVDAGMLIVMNNNYQHTPLQWQYVIAKEAQRMTNLYRFYNLFTDVPGFNSNVKARRYLNWLLRNVKPTHDNTYLYLYLRGFLRRTEYSNLFIRLLLINLVLLLFVRQLWLALLLNMIFIYLICLQLVPLFNQYQGMVMTHLYPLTQQVRITAFQKLIKYLLIVQWLLQSIVVLFKLPILMAVLAIVIDALYALLIWRVYLHNKLQRQSA